MNELTEQISGCLEVLEEAPGAEWPFRIRGTALVQGGLSRNGRYYPPEVVAAAAEQAAAAPLTVYAHHRDRTEGSGLPVGRVDRLYLDGPELKYEARLAPTRLGRDLRVLLEGDFMVGASIRASPYSSRRVRLAGREVEWIDSLTLRGIDFSDDPGVPEAIGFEILEDVAAGAVPAEPAPGRRAAAAGAEAECGRTHGGQQTQRGNPPMEEERMDLRSLDLETLRSQRPDLVEAVCGEAARILEETCRTLGVPDSAQLPAAARDLAGLRCRREITALVDGELAGEPLREAIKARLLEECATITEARERLQRERDYAVALRRVFLAFGTPSGGASAHGPAGAGLVDNPESAALSPKQAHIRRLAGVATG